MHAPRPSQLPVAHGVPVGANESAGHIALTPVQVSATSHSPAAARQLVVAGASASAGQLSAVPSQTSATSHALAAERHGVPAEAALPMPMQTAGPPSLGQTHPVRSQVPGTIGQ